MSIVIALLLLAIAFGVLLWALRCLWLSVRAVDSLPAYLRCLWQGWHNTRRSPLGGQKCRDCGLAGAGMEDMGFVGGGYVPPVRRLFNRDERAFSRTSAWEPGVRGW